MSRPNRRARGRRGAALLLVLVALAIGLLLVATWLDGRRESVPVARRVASGTVARFASRSGLELAVATLDAEEDWRAAIDDRRFATTLALDGAECSFAVVDADTDERPDDRTTRLRVTCVARADEVAATASRIVEVDTAETVLDLGLAETAIVVERTLRIQDEAALLPWVARPGAVVGPLVVGSRDGRLDAVVVAGDAVALDAEVIEVNERPTGVGDAGVRRLPEPLPRIATPLVPAPDLGDRLPDRTTVELSTAPPHDLLSPQVRIPGGARLAIDGDRVIRGLADIVIDHGARITIESGTLVLDAARDLQILGGEIVVADGARLLLRAGRELRLADAVVVPDAIDPELAAGEFPPLDHAAAGGAGPGPGPGLGLDAIVATLDGTDASIEIGGRSAAVLMIVAPDGAVVVEDDAVLHGRIVAAEVDLRDRATVYARPDDGRVLGLTTPEGPHRDDDGRLVAAVAEGDFASDAGLAAIAASIGLEVLSMDRSAVPDQRTTATQADTVRERIRRMIEMRRQRLSDGRWAVEEEDPS